MQVTVDSAVQLGIPSVAIPLCAFEGRYARGREGSIADRLISVTQRAVTQRAWALDFAATERDVVDTGHAP